MTIIINSEEKEVRDNICLQDFLGEYMSIQTEKGIAVAVNERVISHNQWTQYTLQPQDQITVIHAVQGG